MITKENLKTGQLMIDYIKHIWVNLNLDFNHLPHYTQV